MTAKYKKMIVDFIKWMDANEVNKSDVTDTDLVNFLRGEADKDGMDVVAEKYGLGAGLLVFAFGENSEG